MRNIIILTNAQPGPSFLREDPGHGQERQEVDRCRHPYRRYRFPRSLAIWPGCQRPSCHGRALRSSSRVCAHRGRHPERPAIRLDQRCQGLLEPEQLCWYHRLGCPRLRLLEASGQPASVRLQLQRQDCLQHCSCCSEVSLSRAIDGVKFCIYLFGWWLGNLYIHGENEKALCLPILTLHFSPSCFLAQ
jgi:hypothetical protein